MMVRLAILLAIGFAAVLHPGLGSAEPTTKKPQFVISKVESDRIQRRYGLVLGAVNEIASEVPAAEDVATEEASIVIVFHGQEGGATGMDWLMQSRRLFWKAGYHVVYPEALPMRWGGWEKAHHGREVRFVEMILADLEVDRKIRADTLIIVGYSSGVQIASAFACQNSHRVDALALIGQAPSLSDCKPTVQLPTVLVKGLSDPIVPYSGGGREEPSHAETLEFFRKLNDVEVPPQALGGPGKAPCELFSTPAYDASLVVSCLVEDSGHSWPGGAKHLSKSFGPVSERFDASRVLLDFFNQERRRKQPRRAASWPPRPSAVAHAPPPLRAPSNSAESVPDHERGLSSQERLEIERSH